LPVEVQAKKVEVHTKYHLPPLFAPALRSRFRAGRAEAAVRQDTGAKLFGARLPSIGLAQETPPPLCRRDARGGLRERGG